MSSDLKSSACVFALAAALNTSAQITSRPTAQDPLMSLMLSQPKIDVESPVRPTAILEPPVVRPGQEAIYRVSFNALEASIKWPDKIDVPAKLSARAGGHGQMLAMAGPVLQPFTCYIYHLRSDDVGQYVLPDMQVEVYGKQVHVPPAVLQVVSNPPAFTPPQRLLLEVPVTNLFIGQSVRVSIASPPTAALIIQATAPVQIMGEGFLVDQSAFRARTEIRRGPFPLSGPILLYDTLLSPIASGKLFAFAQGFVASRLAAPLVILNGSNGPPRAIPQYTLLDSDPVQLDVRPLPEEGKLPGFTGAVGTFQMDLPDLTTNYLRAGEPLKLRVKIRGDGNLARLVSPPPPRSADWQVLAAGLDPTPPQIIHAQGYATFTYTLVPLSDKVRSTPAVPFSSFDPRLEKYVDLTIPPVPVQVEPGLVPIDAQALAKAESAAPLASPEPMLSGLAESRGLAVASLVPLQQQPWFPVIQLAPAGVFLGLFLWDRRRRYRESHPEIVLRQRTRRRLRRERFALRRAAQAGDAFGVLFRSVRALRLACAPHYPAEPRALVGADVLALLPREERSGRSGELVRRVFVLADQARFAPRAPEAKELISLEPELEHVLACLEARL